MEHTCTTKNRVREKGSPGTVRSEDSNNLAYSATEWVALTDRAVGLCTAKKALTFHRFLDFASSVICHAKFYIE